MSGGAAGRPARAYRARHALPSRGSPMSDPKKGPSPPTWKLALVKWLGLFGPLLALSYGFNFLSRSFLPTDLWFVRPDGTMLLWVKLLCETAVLVPLLNFAITPAMDSLFAGWLYAGIDRDGNSDATDAA